MLFWALGPDPIATRTGWEEYSLGQRGPHLVPALLADPEEGQGLEAEADEDLGEYGEEQRS